MDVDIIQRAFMFVLFYLRYPYKSPDVVSKKLHFICMHVKTVIQRRKRETIHLWKMRSERI